MVSYHSYSDDVQSKQKLHRINILILRFSGCAQFLLATKVGGATAIQKYWLKKPKNIGDLWQTVSDWY